MGNWLWISLVWKYCIDPIVDGSITILQLHKHLKTEEPVRYPKALSKFIIKYLVLVTLLTLLALCF